MAFEIGWQIESKVVSLRLFEDITVEQVIEMHQQWRKLIDMGEKPVHALVDAKDSDKYPMDLRQAVKHSTALQHPDLGWLVLCGAPTYINMLTTVAAQLGRRKLRTFATLEEGLKFLKFTED